MWHSTMAEKTRAPVSQINKMNTKMDLDTTFNLSVS